MSFLTTTELLPYEKERREMIAEQLQRRGIHDERVLEAMFRVPRHEFVPTTFVAAAYDDRPLPIGAAETISQPYIVAAMTEAVNVRPGERTLEIGTGSGYQAAILSFLGAQVYTLERNARLATLARERLARLGYANIEIVAGDGSLGYAPQAPYSVIMVTAAAPAVPPALLEQLADQGRMIIPVGNLHHQDLLLLSKEENQVRTRALDPCQFVPLIGEGGWRDVYSQ